MSEYTDRFIKEHKEYFGRNKLFISNGNWNNLESYTSSVENLKKELLNVKDEKEKKAILNEISSIGETHQKNKTTLFGQENELTNSILSRLSAFIQEIEKAGEDRTEKIRNFIKETVDIINIHLDKCNNYLNYNLDVVNSTEEQEIEFRGQEIKFQDTVFQKKIKIQDSLSKLALDETKDDSEITFFPKEKRAPLILREPLSLLYDDVKIRTEKIPVDWNVLTSKEFFINMRESDIPKWNYKKNYFEQDPVVLQFWTEEYNKIKQGITINGYFIHPWLYFHLNFFKTPIPQQDGTEPNVNPPLRDNEWFFAENLKEAISKEYPDFYSRALLIYGTRRFGKSVILASLAHWRTITKFNSFGSIIGGTSSDLNALTSKIKTSLTYIDRPFKLDTLKQNWENGETDFGIKKTNTESVLFSKLIVQNLEEGATKGSSQKTAGLAPSVSIYDEIGKYPFLKPYLAALPSFKTPYGFKCVTVLAGTGGEADLSRDAMDVLSNPEVYDLQPMNWDLLENKIDPEEITWKRRTFATFFPGQMAYEEGFIKLKNKFSDFVGVEHEQLDKIDIHTTNWKSNREYLERKDKEAENTKGARGKLLQQQRKVQYPKDPEDCFLSSQTNPFPVEEAIRRKEYLLQSGEWDRRRVIYLDDNGKLKSEISNMPLAEYPHKGGIIDAPLLIFEDIPETPPVDNLYIASFDDVKQDDSDTDSLISFQIWKNDAFNDEWAGRLVLSWTLRPGNRKKMYEKWLLLQRAYNAKAFPENEDMGYKTFLEGKHLEDVWLIKGMDFTATMDINSNNKRLYGWTPKQSKKVLMSIFKDKMDDPVVVTEDSEGNPLELRGVQMINDIGMLDEIIYYKEDANVDRLSASLGAVGWIHVLNKNWIYPKENKRTEEVKIKPHIKRVLGGSRRSRLLG